MSGLMQTLLDVNSKDAQTRTSASSFLTAARLSNPPEFLHELAIILSSEAAPKLARTVAGLTLKNSLKNLTQEEGLNDLWTRVEPALKAQIRTCALATLASSDKDIRQSAAQAVAAIAGFDIPTSAWPEILAVLVANAGNTHPAYKQASLLTLGYICEDLVPGTVTRQQSDQVLTAVANALGPGEQNVYIKLDALRALSSILPLAQGNFQNQPERDYLISAVCACASHPEPTLKLLGLQVLCDIAQLYYDQIGANLPELWQVTSAMIREGEEQAAILAVEFWNTLADIEKLREGGQGYLTKATPTLLTLLLSATIRFPNQDEEDFTLRKASCICLTSCALLAGDIAVEPCLTFIAQHVMSLDMHIVSCAIVVFGSILDGPSTEALKPAILGGIDTMIKLMGSPHLVVRKQAAWVLSRICALHYPVLKDSNRLSDLVPTLIHGLQDDPKVALHLGWCCDNLANNPQGDFPFNPYQYKTILTALISLLAATDQETLRDIHISVYMIIGEVISKAPEQCVSVLQAQIPFFLKRLAASDPLTSGDPQRGLCVILESLCARLPEALLTAQISEAIIDGILAVFNNRKAVLEEGLDALGALACSIGDKIRPHIGRILPFLLWALNNRDDTALCKAGTHCLGDFSAAISPEAAQLSVQIMPILVANLEHARIAADIKVMTISTLADLILGAMEGFQPYLETILRLVEQALEASMQVSPGLSPDLSDYLSDLRDAIVEFYIALLQSLKLSNHKIPLQGMVGKLVEFALFAARSDLQASERTQINVLYLLGELLNAFEQVSVAPASRGFLEQFLASFAGRREELKSEADWVRRRLLSH